MPELLLASDLDGTLIGDDQSLRAFDTWVRGRRDELCLAYATGRLFAAVKELVETTPLPAPDLVIGGVGSEIRRFPSGDYVTEWNERMQDHWDAARVRVVVTAFPGVELQPAEYQTDYKVSFYVNNATSRQLADIRRALDDASIHGDVIYSSQRDLDVLPRGVNKGSAVAFLAEQISLDADRVIVAGDTGNDRALFDQPFRGIVVGNAHEELKRLNHPRVYHATQPCAAGVLEGLRHWTARDVDPYAR